MLMPHPVCPRCANTTTRRVPRRGFWQQSIMPLLGLYPWECTACRRIFAVGSRGKLKRRRRAEGEARLPPVG